MKKVLVTGATGFIGSHTVKVLKQAGHYVIGVDRVAQRELVGKYLDQLLIADFVTVADTAAKENSIDAIIHCAGTSLVGPSIKDPYTYFSNNSSKTNIMLENLADSKDLWSGAIVFSSSAAVYGIPSVAGNIEESSSKNPISPYGWSKLFCEEIIRSHCVAHGFKGIALRYFNAAGCDSESEFGHFADDTHLIPRILSAYQNKKEFLLNGNDYKTEDGTCIRDYLHVTDIAQAHLQAVMLADQMSANEFRSYNLGTGNGYSNREIIDVANFVVGDTVQVRTVDRRIGDPDSLVASAGRFQRDANWDPVNSNIDTIVRTSWQWQKKLPLLID